MPATSVPAPLSALPASVLLADLLAVSMTGVIYYTPLYDPAGTGKIVDFTFEYLNPAAQRMMRMPEVPTLTHNEQWPHSKKHGTFQFHVEAYVTGEPREFNINYQADGYDNYYRLAARRSGEGLLVSFTDTADQPRTSVEVALRQAQVELQAAHAAAETQRQQWQRVLQQAPVAIAVLDGPEYCITLANPPVCEIWARTQEQVVGLPLFEALPEVRGQGLEELLEGVLRTGQPYVGTELPIQLLRRGQLETVYFTFVYQPQRNANGATTGVLVVATDVSEMVLARQRVEVQEQETAQLNEELAAANETMQANFNELTRSQMDLLSLNQELEIRVQDRTQAALALQADLLEAAQAQVREREAFYQIFAQTPAAICIQRGPDHRFEYVNQAYQDFFPGRQLLGRPVADALPETVSAGAVELLDRVYQTGETYYGQELLVRVAAGPDTPARDIYFTFTYQAYREQGAIVGISTFAYDVTEQVLTRQARETERQQLLSLFAQAPAGICILVGPKLLFEFVNPAFQQLLPGRQLLGHSIFETMSEIEDTSVGDMLREVYSTGISREEQALRIPVARPTDGVLEDRYFSFVCQARHNEQGRVDGVLVFVFEVTAQQQATDALRESEARFRIMADAAPNQVWAVNPDSSIRYANQAFLDFVGMSLEQYVKKGWTEFLHPEDLGLAQGTLEEAIRTRSLYRLEHRMRRQDGEYRWLLAQGAPSFYPNGELYGYVGSAIDITELKQTNAQLTRINQDLDNFVYAASHDLKQPVNNLAGLFEELRRSTSFTDPAEEHVLVPLIQDALQQLGHTIDDLAMLGQAQQVSEVSLSEQVSLASLTEEVVSTLEPQIRAARARITVDFDARPTVAFARANLRTILLNLLGNSLKYADPMRPARIHVSVWVEDGQPVLVVQDNGLGFDAQKHGAELFHLFRRLHTHTAGSGVGLYLVNRIVQAHGGGITVESQPGEGATFRIRLGRAWDGGPRRQP